MGTVTKTIRIDKEFLDLVGDFVKLVKEVFGFDITVNSVLAGSIVNGFGNQLSTFKLIAGNFEITPSFPGEKIPSKEQIDKIKLFLERYEQYSLKCEFGEDSNEIEEDINE